MCHLKHVEQLRNIGIINSTTRLHLLVVSIRFTETKEKAEINVHFKNIWLQIPVVKITKLSRFTETKEKAELNVHFKNIWLQIPVVKITKLSRFTETKEKAEINAHFKNIWLQIPVVNITKLLSFKLKTTP